MSKAARNSLWLGVVFWAATCGALQGQEGPINAIDEVVGRDRALLAQADERLRAGDIAETLDLLLPLAEEQGQKLIPLYETAAAAEFTTFISMEEAIFRRMAAEPKAVKELRDRYGVKWGGASLGQPVRPGRLEARMFAGGTAEEWVAQADELTRRGRINDARDRLLRISSIGAEAEERPWFALAKSSELDAAAIARLVYLSLLEESPLRAKRERDRLARQFPEARGKIAGREELILERVDAWIAESANWESPDSVLGECQIRRSITVSDKPLWQRYWSGGAKEEEADIRRVASVFPCFADQQIFVSRGAAVYAWPELDGELRGELASEPAALYRATIKPERAAPLLGATRNFLASAEGFVFARVGSPVTRKRSAVPTGDHVAGVIISLDAKRGGTLLMGFPMPAGSDEEFDGPPTIDGERMFVVIRKRDEARTQHLVRCIDIASAKLIWERSICSAETAGRGVRDEANQSAVHLDGERFYVATNLGCVACLDGETGRIRWLTKYPRSAFPAEGEGASRWNRGLGGLHLRGERLVVLAADCERVFALHGLSGELLWASRRELMQDACYVLGATEAEVRLMGESVYWLNATNGQVKACYPERWVEVGGGPSDPHTAVGRGIWAGNAVFYPTRDAILEARLDSSGKVLVTVATNLAATATANPGNLAWNEGRLYWASESAAIGWQADLEKNSKSKPAGRAKE